MAEVWIAAIQTQSEIAEIFIDIGAKYGTDEKYRLVLPILILSPQKSFLLEYETHQIRELVLQARHLQFVHVQYIKDLRMHSKTVEDLVET